MILDVLFDAAIITVIIFGLFIALGFLADNIGPKGDEGNDDGAR